MNSNLDLFLLTIPYALKGWLAIFIVTFLIVVSITLLNKITCSKKDNNIKTEE